MSGMVRRRVFSLISAVALLGLVFGVSAQPVPDPTFPPDGGPIPGVYELVEYEVSGGLAGMTFTLRVYPDGQASWGINNLSAATDKAKLTAAELAQLKAEFKKAGFKKLKNNYKGGGFDVPTRTVTYRETLASEKTVVVDGFAKIPKKLSKLLSYLDQLVQLLKDRASSKQSVKLNLTAKPTAEQAEFRLTIKNTSGQTLELPSILYGSVAFRVWNSKGKLVYDSLAHKVFPMILPPPLVLGPGKTATAKDTWDYREITPTSPLDGAVKVGPGTYRVRAFWGGKTTKKVKFVVPGLKPPIDVAVSAVEGFGAAAGWTFTLNAKNVSGKKLDYEIGAQEYDFLVRDDSGKVVWQWSHGKAWIMIVYGKTLKPGQVLAFTEHWNGTNNDGKKLANGLYTVTGIFKAAPGYTSKPAYVYLSDEVSPFGAAARSGAVPDPTFPPMGGPLLPGEGIIDRVNDATQ